MAKKSINTEAFKYLGALLEYNNSFTSDQEVNARVTAGTCKFCELINFFKTAKLHLTQEFGFSNRWYGLQSGGSKKTRPLPY